MMRLKGKEGGNCFLSVNSSRGNVMAVCKKCRCPNTFEHVVDLETDGNNLYQCANCCRVVVATMSEIDEEYRVI